jgi:peptidyl-prolyl cis-trans isomerase D
MFSFFRRGVTSKIMLVILGLGILAMVATGFGTGSGGMGGIGTGGGDAVATIEGEKITDAEVIDMVNRQLARAREQQPELDMGNFLQGGALEEIIRQMIAAKAMNIFGTEQGLAASKKLVDAEIAGIPGFRNLAGQFDETVFRQKLQAEGITEQRLREDIAGSLIERQLLMPIEGAAKVPQGMALQYASLLLERRTGSIGLVSAQAMGRGTPPTDAEVATFYREQQGRYTIPERRVLRYALIGPEQVAAAAQPTQAEIEGAYRAAGARYAARETRTLNQVVLPDQAAARAFQAKLQAGKSFAQAATEAGFSVADTRIGEQDRAQFANLTSPAAAAAAFAAAQGATTAPVQSPLGWHIVNVRSINRKPATPLAAVRAELERAVAQQKQATAFAALVGRVEDAIADGANLDEVAKAQKLIVLETPAITAAGTQFDNPHWRAPELAPLLKTAFDMTPDDDPVVEPLANGSRAAVLAVSRLVPAAAPPLAQILPRVRADLITRRAAERARAVATAIVAKINAGVPPARAFAEAKLPLPPVQPVSARRLDIARANQQVPPPLLMMFSLPKGKARILRAPEGAGWFVVHLASTVPGNAADAPGLVEATRTQFERVLGAEYAEQFAGAAAAELDVERDPDAIKRIRRQLLGAGSGL